MPTPSKPHRDEESLPLYEIEHDLTAAMSEWLSATEALEAAEADAKHGRPVDPNTYALMQDAAAEAQAVVAAYLDGAEAKRDSIGRYVVNLQQRAGNLKAEIDRLATAHKRAKRKAEGLLSYVAYTMRAMGETKLAGRTIEFRLTNNPASVEIDNEAAIPNYLRQPPKPGAPDKTRIKEVMLATVEQRIKLAKQDDPDFQPPAKHELGQWAANSVSGARLVTDKFVARIK